MVPRTLPGALPTCSPVSEPHPRPPEPGLLSLSEQDQGRGVRSQQQTEGRGSAWGRPPQKVWKLSSETRGQAQHGPRCQGQPQPPRNPHGGAWSGGEACWHCDREWASQAALTQPSCSCRTEATPGGHGGAWPRCTAWGEGTFPHLKGKLGKRRKAHSCTAWKEGAQVLTQPDLGHLPLPSDLAAGTWMGLIQGPSPALLSV